MMALTVAKLKALCRVRGLKVSGRKAELITRLVGGAPQVPAVLVPLPVKRTAQERLAARRPKIVLEKSVTGDYIHRWSGVVVDKELGRAVGQLTYEDILECRFWQIPYTIPTLMAKTVREYVEPSPCVEEEIEDDLEWLDSVSDELNYE